MNFLSHGPVSRRRALRRLSAGALLSLGLWPGCASTRYARGENFRFIVVNDIHYLSRECGAWLEGVVRGMGKHAGIEFCLVAGDLVEKGEREHLGVVRDIFSTLRVPSYAVMGNHDFLAANDAANYEKVFPGRRNYWFEHRGWQFIGLDSTQGTAYEKTSIQAPTLRWVDEHARELDRRKPSVIFTHFPLGAGVRYRPLNADDLLERFREFNLRAVFNGHFHASTERTWVNATVTTNRCCALKRGNHDGTKEKGYFVCDVRDGVLQRTFIQCETPARVPAA